MEVFKVIGQIVSMDAPKKGVTKDGKQWIVMSIRVKNVKSKQKEVYPIDIVGLTATDARLTEGAMGEFIFNIEAHEFKGRWYPQLKCFAFNALEGGNVSRG